MSYHGTVKNGVVVLDEPIALADGQRVEVTLVEGQTSSLVLPAFGIWKNRSDLGDSAEESLRIRREMEQRQK